MNILRRIAISAALTATLCMTAAPTGDRHLQLEEITVRPGKEKYSKKNNPAVDFVEQVMARRNMTDPRLNNDFYNHNLYERINIGVINPPVDSTGALGFLAAFVDTTELSGRPVLNLSVKEKVSNVHYRRSPRGRREVVRLRNRNGLDDLIADANSMQTIFEEFMRPVDLYDEDDITILRQKFVSPLGRRATDFYKYYLSDTVADEARGDSLVVLTFVPHNPAMPSFNGRIYVVKGDSAMFIRRAELRMPAESNVNFINEMMMVQEYDRAPDGSRLKTLDEVVIEARYVGVDTYASRLSAYSNHNFNQPEDSTVFDSPAEVIERNDLQGYVASFRPADEGAAARGANNMGSLMERLRRNKVFYWGERTLSALISDWVRPGGAKAPVAIGPIFSTVSHNDLEGWRLRLGARTTAALSPHWFLSGYGAYGFEDRRWKYSGSVEYSFNKKQLHQGEFPIRSLRLTHTYDVDRLGQHYSSSGTLFNSLTFTKNDLMTYSRLSEFVFTWETEKHLAVSVGLTHTRQEESPYVEFVDGYGRHFGHFTQTAATLELRWAPGEKYYQSMNGRKPMTTENPVVRLTHTYAPSGLFGARWGVNKTEMSVDKRWYLSAWGHVDVRLGAGHVWNHTVFPSLLMPNTNLSYFYQRNAFSLMKPLEFVTDNYAELHVNYSANGALLNYIPLIKKLKLREIVGFHAVWGSLRRSNNPLHNAALLQFPMEAGTTQPDHVPYMELNVGISNIARILSVFYVRRLTHLGPGIERNGVRVAFTFGF